MQHAFQAGLAQSVERKALNLVVVGSSPTVGDACCSSIWHHELWTGSLNKFATAAFGQAPLA